MARGFSGGAEGAFWPMKRVVSALKARFGDVDSLGEDGPLKIYGVQDNGVNFVVALVQSEPGSEHVSELGFLARFVGFPVSAEVMENLNRNLHISVASIENNDLFLMAGMEVIGPFDESQFNLILEQWRRDLAICIHGLTDEAPSIAAAFPAARLEAARKFAVNMAPPGDAKSDVDMLATFMGAGGPTRVACGDCGGRGKRGLIVRACKTCEGTGIVRKG
ncbi:MAG: hypothetical protein AAGD92_13840 [Pseudomonadota bacterium]